MKALDIRNLGQISKAHIDLGDLTVLTGPQATGKSLFMQTLKLVTDTKSVVTTLKRHGFDKQHEPDEFLELYYGEGMGSIWTTDAEVDPALKTEVLVDGKPFDLPSELLKKTKPVERTFLIPAQRVLILDNDWPRPFTVYGGGTPYALRNFSERMRLLMEAGLGRSGPVFPQENRLRKVFREKIDDGIFHGAKVAVDTTGPKKRIVLNTGGNATDRPLPFAVWSAGQREFVPLMLGLYWLLPSRARSRQGSLKYVIIEEPEMGLHPRAVSSLMFLLFELLYRGYRLVLSTHTQTVLDVVWAMGLLKKAPNRESRLLKIFDAPDTKENRALAGDVLGLTCKTHHFGWHEGKVRVTDISTLDPGDGKREIAGWGGLTEFSSHVADIVADTVADSGGAL